MPDSIYRYINAIPDKRTVTALTKIFQTIFPSDPTVKIITATGAIALTTALHAGKTVLLNSAAGVPVTVPPATGSGNQFRIVLGVTVTTPSTTITVTGSTLSGIATLVSTATANFNATAPNSIITLNGSTSGGFVGDEILLTDIAAGVYQVRILAKATSTAISPFS